MKTAGQQDPCAPWLLLCVSLCACTCLAASAPPNLVCLSDVESTFLSRLSSHEQWELAQLAGVNPPATEPATWGDRAVARRMQCLPSDRAALLVEALAELGCVPAEANRQLAASTDSGDVTARDIGGGTRSREQPPALSPHAQTTASDSFGGAIRAQHNAETGEFSERFRGPEEGEEGEEAAEEAAARLADAIGDAEHLLAPGSCWNDALGPQVFFAEPAVHLDPADPSRHITSSGVCVCVCVCACVCDVAGTMVQCVCDV